MDVTEMAERAGRAAALMGGMAAGVKDRALGAVADALHADRERILAANREDVRSSEANGLSAPLLKRLKFDAGKLAAAVEGVRSVAGLPDPAGRTLSAMELAAGLELFKVSCPIGVIGVVFESRPDALVQISSLGLKSGNAVLLKGGREAANTNRVLADVIAGAGERSGLPGGWLQLLETRAHVEEMLRLDRFIDLVIPRGSNEFVRHVMEHTNIPVLGHADGLCHVYVDAGADLDMAVNLTVDSKCQYAAVCNAAETLLVHEAAAAEFLPRVKRELDRHGVEIRGCARTRDFIEAKAATEADWGTEYLDLILSVRVVAGLDEAIAHINRYGSRHTDAIVTGDPAAARRFMDRVDSGNVFWNCSTRFSDGFRYGLGAEVGISTGKIHARGPVGLDGLVTYKWRLVGSGQTVAPFVDGTRRFTHRPLDRPFDAGPVPATGRGAASP